MTQPLPTQIEQLRALIGTHILHHDQEYRLVEVIDDGPYILLQYTGPQTIIQADQHGNAHRRVPETLMIPLFTPDKLGFDIVFSSLEMPVD